MVVLAHSSETMESDNIDSFDYSYDDIGKYQWRRRQ